MVIPSMSNVSRILFIVLALACQLVGQDIFTDRKSFAAHPRDVEQVPLDAFMFGEEFAKDLKIEVWAQSPMIFSPVAMDIDPQGRLWLTEGIDYNVGKRIKGGQSIIVLSDTDHDGKADHSHIFVTEPDARPAPLGIAVFDNKIVLSSTPSMTVYTDVDRNAIFDPAIDKKETFLTGFQNKRHDHTLHAVVGSPSGQWYFSYGNCGADIETKDGRHFLSACYYGYADAIGKPSSDGHVYVGGVAMRINPDGTGLTPVGHNLRNSHDMFVSSFGDVLQSDNDDPAHCRSSWLMEHGNMGYADLKDGSRSWEEVSKSWDEPQGWHRDLRYSRSHWRQNYPGATPPGSIYGAGSPTGNVFIEGDELGENNRGVYLVCDMMRKEVMACRPVAEDAQIEMGPHRPFLTLKEDSKGEHFLPTDVVLGTDGALYLSDFYNDTSRRTNQLSGTIYRITRREQKPTVPPTVDFESPNGLLEALKSPAVNVRAEAVARLKTQGELVAAMLVEFFTNESNPFIKARAPWVLAQLGASGQAMVGELLKSDNVQHRLVAFRALRFAAPERILPMARELCRDPSLSIRREIATALRDVPFEGCQDVLAVLIEGYDGKNRWYLEALGIAATKKEQVVYEKLIRPRFANTPPVDWDDRAKNLAWRFHTPEAIEDLHRVILAQKPMLETFRHLVMAYASFRSDSDRQTRREKLAELAKLPAFSEPEFQITVEEILARDLNDLKGEPLRTSYRMPTAFGEKTELSDINTIAALKGHAADGKLKAQVCLACHKVEGTGVAFGPDLTYWGQNRTIAEIITELLDPSAKLAHGYDKPVRLTAGEHVAEGLLSNFSWHAGSLKIKLFGGQTKKILFRESGAKVDHLENHSWMPPASHMGLKDQDVRDVAAYLKTLGASTE
ncbi:MAG: putative membrane-bound dehydrogenase-like protein [Verrucomicrobiales bacterium]|jgi:putative membrane-bound dehydrogenase-like protein